jgi:hypothetical protein
VLRLQAAPAARYIHEAVETLKTLNTDNTRKVPKDAPTSFVKKRWESSVFTADGVDRPVQLAVQGSAQRRFNSKANKCQGFELATISTGTM